MTWVSFGFNFLKRKICGFYSFKFNIVSSAVPENSTVSEDARIEPGTVTTLKLGFRRSIPSAISHPDKKGANTGISCIGQCKCKHSLCLRDRIYVLRNRLSKNSCHEALFGLHVITRYFFTFRKELPILRAINSANERAISHLLAHW
jgi:hypothetical protein